MGLLTRLENARKRRDADELLRQGGDLFCRALHEAARETWRKALGLYEELHDDAGIAAASMNIAAAAYSLSDYDEAFRYGETGLRLSRRSDDTDGIIRALAVLGGTAQKTGNLECGLDHQQESVRLARKLDRYETLVLSLSNQGEILIALGRYVEAESSLQAAVQLVEEHDETRDRKYAAALNLLGSMYREVGEHALANEAFGRVKTCAAAIDDPFLESQAVTNQAVGLLIERRWEEAAVVLQRNIALKRRVSDPKGEVVALINLARAQAALARYDEALRSLADARSIVQRTGNHHGEWVIEAATAQNYLLRGRLDEARRHGEAAVALATSFGGPADVAAMQGELSAVLITTGDPVRAIAALTAAVDAGENLRADMADADEFRVSIFEEHVKAYEDLQWALAATGDVNRALEVSERGRARALAVALARQNFHPEAPPDLATIRGLAEELRTTFVVYSLVPDPVARAHDLRNPEVFVWVIPRDRHAAVLFHRTGLLSAMAPEEIEAAADSPVESRHAAGFTPHHGLRFDESELRFFHELLIAPIAHALPDDPAEFVTFVPGRELFVLPFAALTDPNGTRLVERHTTHVTPSLQTLALTRGVRDIRGSGALIVGNPNTELPPLPGTAREARAIAKKLGVKPLLGAAAKREAVIAAMPGKRFLHFGTHGAFDPRHRASLYGRLSLTGGKLTAADIAEMKLDADLTVLSACHTGYGRFAADGLIGLSRAFLLAGVPRVISTLWAVPDRSAAELMVRFYDHLNEGPAAALRKAMLATIAAGYTEPADWAGFVLIGHA
jgi:CHAT domain-containing protein